MGERSYALLSGEIHYWRTPKLYWRDALARAKDLGLEIIASYACWDHHELAAGRFDLKGDSDPSRDLVGFLQLVKDMRLAIILRPGPYIYSEWRNSGVPERVVKYHRTSSEFREAARGWLEAVLRAARPFLATNGGPIVMVQADNEPDAWTEAYARELGLFDKPGPFQDFLRERYRSIEALNGAWGTSHRDFADARGAVLEPVSVDRGERVRYLDGIRFRQHYATDIVSWTVRTLRQLGVDVPIYANAYSGFGAQDWRALETASDLAGPDLYPSQEFRAGAEEHRRFLDRLRFTRTYSKLPYIPEFGAGIWHGWHYWTGVHTANHYTLSSLSALVAGIAGWNWYMLVERDNWYGTPISGVARARPDLAPAFGEIIRLFREIDVPSLEKITDTAVTVDVVEQGAKLDPDHPVLTALHQADIDHECCDVETGAIAKPLLFYAGGEWLSRAAAERLAAYVEAGGQLVFVQRLPRFDEQLRAANPLGLRPPDAVLGSGNLRRVVVLLGERRLPLPATPFASYADVPGAALHAECEPWPQQQEGLHLHATLTKGERHVVGYRETRGKGSVVVLGVSPTPQLVVAVQQWLGVPIASRARTPGVSTALFRRGDKRFLIAVNTTDADLDEPVLLADAAIEARDLRTGATSTPAGNELHLRLGRKNGTVVELT
ncbi:MAG: hypothetical protein E6I87_12375 [Chloroflexi bacterium]|nr:MAG: hypothetical protein E6I87_12375 [Chloroflexota bacterium]